jgi:hypothetical protein
MLSLQQCCPCQCGSALWFWVLFLVVKFWLKKSASSACTIGFAHLPPTPPIQLASDWFLWFIVRYLTERGWKVIDWWWVGFLMSFKKHGSGCD